jgi:hypothetical protein
MQLPDLVWKILSATGFITAVASLVKLTLITKLQEGIKHDYAQRLEAIKHDNAQQLEAHKANIDSQLEQFRTQLAEIARVAREQWNIKLNACFDALQLVDDMMTNRNWGVEGITPQPVDVRKAREVYNRLTLTCRTKDVFTAYLDCLGIRTLDKPTPVVRGDCMHDLRLAIRNELDFGPDFEMDRERSWIATLGQFRRRPDKDVLD